MSSQTSTYRGHSRFFSATCFDKKAPTPFCWFCRGLLSDKIGHRRSTVGLTDKVSVVLFYSTAVAIYPARDYGTSGLSHVICLRFLADCQYTVNVWRLYILFIERKGFHEILDAVVLCSILLYFFKVYVIYRFIKLIVVICKMYKIKQRSNIF